MNKNIYIIAIAMSALGISSCKNDHDDVRPGIYLEHTVMETFPGDTLLISGQVSNYVGIRSIEMICDAWGTDVMHDFGSEHPKVMEFDYKVPVPMTATFDQDMRVIVTDKNGLENERIIQMRFAPDTKAPEITGLQAYNSVEYSVDEKKGLFNLNFTCSDDRKIDRLYLSMTEIAYEETIINDQGRILQLERELEFTSMGSFELNVRVVDESGNETSQTSAMNVTMPENEYQIEDYKQMYAVCAHQENPDDYIDGYYHYMERIGEYRYQCVVNADDAKDGFLFVPTKSMSGYVYGSSPYANFKILNNKDYVVPTRLEQPGYYTLTLDIAGHSFTIEPLEMKNIYNKSSLMASGDGFRSFDDWGAMKKVKDYHYTVFADQDGAAKPEWGRYYYFVGVTDDGGWDWTRIFRADAEGHKWYEVDGGNGALTYESDYDGRVEITFDTAIPFGTIKKVK